MICLNNNNTNSNNNVYSGIEGLRPKEPIIQYNIK